MTDLQKRMETFMELTTLPDFAEFVYWDNLQNRKIIINQTIDDSIVERVIMQILKFNDEDKHIPREQRKPIEIYLNTGGGHVDIGMVLCSVIKQSETPVHVIALGLAASMGSLILMSGHVRKAYDYTNVLIHDGSVGVQGTTGKVKDHIKFQEEKDQQIKDFILQNTKITEEKYDSMLDREWWMIAQTALEYGIIDEII